MQAVKAEKSLKNDRCTALYITIDQTHNSINHSFVVVVSIHEREVSVGLAYTQIEAEPPEEKHHINPRAAFRAQAPPTPVASALHADFR